MCIRQLRLSRLCFCSGATGSPSKGHERGRLSNRTHGNYKDTDNLPTSSTSMDVPSPPPRKPRSRWVTHSQFLVVEETKSPSECKWLNLKDIFRRSLSPGKFKTALLGRKKSSQQYQSDDSSSTNKFRDQTKSSMIRKSNLYSSHGNVVRTNEYKPSPCIQKLSDQEFPMKQQSSKPRALRQRHRSQEDMLSSSKVRVEPLDLSQL